MEKLDYYRIYLSDDKKSRFIDVLETIRSDESKIQRIDPGTFTWRIDITVSEEELAFLKLAIGGIRVTWIQEWKND